jgi:hypothetical protein
MTIYLKKYPANLTMFLHARLSISPKQLPNYGKINNTFGMLCCPKESTIQECRWLWSIELTISAWLWFHFTYSKV